MNKEIAWEQTRNTDGEQWTDKGRRTRTTACPQELNRHRWKQKKGDNRRQERTNATKNKQGTGRRVK